MGEDEKEEMKTGRKNAIEKMKGDAKKGKIPGHKQQKDFLKSILADNDDEADMDPEVADALMESQLSYAEELKKKFQRKKQGKADATDADFEAPSKDEINEMMQQTLKLKKQRKSAKQAKLDKEEFDKPTKPVNTTKPAKSLTKAEREAKRAEKKANRASQKKEMKMLRDLQAVQGNALLEEMKKGGKKTAVQEQTYGETYMKTTCLDAASIDEQMYTDASGNKKMQIGKGSKATQKGEDAVAEKATATTTTKPAGSTTKPAGTTTKPAGSTTKPAGSTTKAAGSTTKQAGATKTRLLQDAKATNAGKADAAKADAGKADAGKATPTTTTATSTAAAKDGSWKKLKKEEDYMRVVIDKKMFETGGLLEKVKKPIITFNKHSPDFVSDFPKGRKADYDATTGKKKEMTKEQKEAKVAKKKAAAKAAGGDQYAYVDEDDFELEETVAQQVMELEFLDGETMEKVEVKNLPKGMLQICMMMKNDKQKLMYMNEENEQMQEDGISKNSMKQRSTQDETNQRERKGYEMCVDLTHATTFATVDDEASSSLFSYSMMVLMTLLAVLFFKQE